MEREHDAASRASRHGGARKPWVRPAIDDLPKLTDLTLQTGNPIIGGGGTGDGGSSVF
jgi:hypothetical protein